MKRRRTSTEDIIMEALTGRVVKYIKKMREAKTQADFNYAKKHCDDAISLLEAAGQRFRAGR